MEKSEIVVKSPSTIAKHFGNLMKTPLAVVTDSAKTAKASLAVNHGYLAKAPLAGATGLDNFTKEPLNVARIIAKLAKTPPSSARPCHDVAGYCLNAAKVTWSFLVQIQPKSDQRVQSRTR